MEMQCSEPLELLQLVPLGEALRVKLKLLAWAVASAQGLLVGVVGQHVVPRRFSWLDDLATRRKAAVIDQPLGPFQARSATSDAKRRQCSQRWRAVLWRSGGCSLQN